MSPCPAWLSQLINSYLSHHADRPTIEPVTKHGTTSAVRVAAVGNIFCTAKSVHATPSKRQMVSHRALFSTSATARAETAEQAMQSVLHSAGASQNRDAVDVRVINEVLHRRFAAPISSQRDVGGWPTLDGREGQPEALARRLFVRRFVGA